jgi:Tol biopolymer transport system component
MRVNRLIPLLIAGLTLGRATASELVCEPEIIPTGMEARNGRLTGDGTRIIYRGSVQAPTGLYSFDLSNGDVQPILLADLRQPVIDHDGCRIAFLSDDDLTGANPDLNAEVYVYDCATGNVVQASHSAPGEFNESLGISSDGTRVMFVSSADLTGSNPDHFDQIYVYDVDNGTTMQLTSGGLVTDTPVALASNGTLIAFPSSQDPLGTNADGNLEIFTIEVDSAVMHQVTTTSEGKNWGPYLRKDGGQVFFDSTSWMDSGLWVISHDISSGVSEPLFQASQGFLVVRPAASDDGHRVAAATEYLTQIYDLPNSSLFEFSNNTSVTWLNDLDSLGRRILISTDANLGGQNPDRDHQLYMLTCGLLIFDDGFETGDLSTWPTSIPSPKAPPP